MGQIGRPHLAVLGRALGAVLAAATCVASLVGCGGSTSGAIPPTVVKAETADVGASLRSDEWEVTLLDQPHKDDIVGDESEEGIQLQTQYQTVAREAEGVWIVVPVRLTNVGEENMLATTTLQVRDDQGREFKIGDRLVHNTEVLVASAERWGDTMENQLVQNVFDGGVTREGPAIFDVADDAKGLELILKGAEGGISLGF
jgi:hypothetical protein